MSESARPARGCFPCASPSPGQRIDPTLSSASPLVMASMQAGPRTLISTEGARGAMTYRDGTRRKDAPHPKRTRCGSVVHEVGPHRHDLVGRRPGVRTRDHLRCRLDDPVRDRPTVRARPPVSHRANVVEAERAAPAVLAEPVTPGVGGHEPHVRLIRVGALGSVGCRPPAVRRSGRPAAGQVVRIDRALSPGPRHASRTPAMR